MSRIKRTRFKVPDYSCNIWYRGSGTLYQLISTYSLYKILGRFVRFDFISSFFLLTADCSVGGTLLSVGCAGEAPSHLICLVPRCRMLQCCSAAGAGRVQTAGTMTAANITPPRGHPDNAATSRNTVAYIEENSVTSFRLGK